MITLERSNLYKLTSVSGEEITCGQGKSGSFSAALGMGCFRGKGKLSLIPQLSGNFSPEIQGEKLVIDHNSFKIEVLTTPVLKDFNEYGGIDYIITLKRKPPTNRISFGYDPTVLVPHHQPPLTSAEIAEGCFRPDWVVNSIAWYHATKGGLVTPADVADRITTGKAFHQYRLRLVAADNSWVWADWLLEAGNLVTLYVDQSFLNTKPYPMMLMPVADTFGDTTTSGTTTSVANRIAGHIFACPAAGTGDSTSCWVRTTTSNKAMKGGLYDTVDPNSNLITNGGTGENTVVANGAHWETFTFTTGPSLSITNYRVIVFSAGGTGTAEIFYDSGTRTLDWQAQTYGAYPTVDWGQIANRDFSLYCTYTPSGGGWTNISKVNDVSEANIGSIMGVAKASIGKVSGVAV